VTLDQQLRRAGSYVVLAAIGVVPAMALAAGVEFVFFSRMAGLMTHSVHGPLAVLTGWLRVVAAVSGGLQYLGAGVAFALIARGVEANRAGREPILRYAFNGSGARAGSLAAVLLVSSLIVGMAFAVASAVGAVVAFFVCLAPIAVAVDGETAPTAFRRGVRAALRTPVRTALLVGCTAFVLIMLNLLRLAFSLSAAQFGHFSFGVQGVGAVTSVIVVAFGGVLLARGYLTASGK